MVDVPEQAAFNPYAQSSPQPYPATPYVAGPPQGLSIVSMVLGIVAVLVLFTGLSWLPGMAAIITGHLAQRSQPSAKPFWLTGLITGYVAAGVSLLVAAFFTLAIVLAVVRSGT